ncbi:alpha/beta fold hydrolase [Nocardia sp. CDC160]|uniref:alpha/beta fold hydrolase n=1 Tax=Nocardia sp. CDC160 TaxID=3112166 RepID=UPI002DBA36F8|nr:alpha/beta hydrolase [Nocardia sp. CDC160]MEC3916989.1 alpha/beta hydrolase [Nocardia sp. CDC160]
MEPTKGFVDSKDGTRIAYTRYGSGPAVVLVDGGLAAQDFGPNKSLAEALSSRYTVYTYDRRGRGGSGETLPVDVEREFEDLDAVADLAGEPVMLYGISSGGALILDYLRSGRTVRKVALYEVPFVVDDGTRPPAPDDYVEHIHALLAQGKNGEVVKYFMRQGVRLPALMVAAFPLFPGWSHLKKVAPTMAYDIQYVEQFQRGRKLPTDRWTDLGAPVTVIAGSKSPAWMRNANAALAQAIPGATHQVLPGQTHLVKAAALAPALIEFFG